MIGFLTMYVKLPSDLIIKADYSSDRLNMYVHSRRLVVNHEFSVQSRYLSIPCRLPSLQFKLHSHGHPDRNKVSVCVCVCE